MTVLGRRYHVPGEARINDELLKIDRDIRGAAYFKADLPQDGSLMMTVCSDEAGGPTIVFWDGTTSVWRRAYDLAIVS